MKDKHRGVIVIGIGGAGCGIVGRMVEAGAAEGLSTAVVDSDACALAESPATSRIQIGEDRLSGFGSGGDVDAGRLAMEDGVGAVLSFAEGVQLAILVAGAGGGIGGGGVPVLAEELRSAGILVLCFVVTPFAFEGRQRMSASAHAVEAISHSGAVVVLAPADALMGSPAEALPEVFDRAADVLGGAVLSLYHTVASPGYIRIGFPEVRRLAADTNGPCRFAFADAAGKDRVALMIQHLKTSPMLENGDLLSKSRLLLVSLVGGPDMTLKEVGDIMSVIDESVRPECRVTTGTAISEAWSGRLSAVVIAGGKRRVTPSVDMPAADPASEPEPPEPKVPDVPTPFSVRSRRGRTRQARLPLDASGRGRFKDVEPTILNGEDLDVPTFVRRGIKIDR